MGILHQTKRIIKTKKGDVMLETNEFGETQQISSNVSKPDQMDRGLQQKKEQLNLKLMSIEEKGFKIYNIYKDNQPNINEQLQTLKLSSNNLLTQKYTEIILNTQEIKLA